jgi:hypothetical protein
VVPLLLDVRAGSHAEFSSAIPHEKYVAELVEQGMIRFILGIVTHGQGYNDDETDQVREKKHEPIFTSG